MKILKIFPILLLIVLVPYWIASLFAPKVQASYIFQGTANNCTPTTIAYTNTAFQVASTTADSVLFALLSRGKVTGVNIKHSAAFAGTGLASMTVSVGDGNATFDQYASAFDIFQAPGDTVFQDSSEFKSTTMTGAGSSVSAHFIGNTNLGEASVAITAANNANPVQLTSVGHGMVNGNPVTISGATGNWTPINGAFIVTRIDNDNFTIPVDAGTFGALTGAPVFNGSFLTAGSVEITVCRMVLP